MFGPNFSKKGTRKFGLGGTALLELNQSNFADGNIS